MVVPMAKPLLMLVMILKDEAATIEKTLKSVKPFIDRWSILDTGSTDNTKAVVRAALAGVPGELHAGSFIDFATTRNKSFDLAGQAAEWIMYLDADDELQNATGLRSFLETLPPADEAVFLNVRVPGAFFPSTRIVRSSAGWKFYGVVHEVLCSPSGIIPTRTVPDAVIDHRDGPDGGARTRKRWERDVDLLEDDFKKTGSHRSAFYAAMTLYWLGRYGAAVVAFTRRIALGGFAEEVFVSTLSKARAMQGTGAPFDEVLPVFLAAHTLNPKRAEPLFDIAAWYHYLDNHPLTVLFARRAFELEPPPNVLFLEEETYSYKAAELVAIHAWYLEHYTLGEAAARAAYLARPEDPRFLQNLKFYIERATP